MVNQHFSTTAIQQERDGLRGIGPGNLLSVRQAR